jgi:predicted Zn-dependent protease
MLWSTSGTSVTSSADKDGSSYGKAIVVKAKNETKGIAAEYKWLQENYPGYKLRSQSLDSKDKKHYDIMHITTKDGDEKSIYFDITHFFGKW